MLKKLSLVQDQITAKEAVRNTRRTPINLLLNLEGNGYCIFISA